MQARALRVRARAVRAQGQAVWGRQAAFRYADWAGWEEGCRALGGWKRVV